MEPATVTQQTCIKGMQRSYRIIIRNDEIGQILQMNPSQRPICVIHQLENSSINRRLELQQTHPSRLGDSSAPTLSVYQLSKFPHKQNSLLQCRIIEIITIIGAPVQVRLGTVITRPTLQKIKRRIEQPMQNVSLTNFYQLKYEDEKHAFTSQIKNSR